MLSKSKQKCTGPTEPLDVGFNSGHRPGSNFVLVLQRFDHLTSIITVGVSENKNICQCK